MEYPADIQNAAHSWNMPQNDFLEQVNRVFEGNFDDDSFGIFELAVAVSISPSQLYRKIKALTGHSPSTYLRGLRLKKSRHLLAGTDIPVTEIGYAVGFSTPSYFSRTFAAEYGLSPVSFRLSIRA